jgi:hypothetical protein
MDGSTVTPVLPVRKVRLSTMWTLIHLLAFVTDAAQTGKDTVLGVPRTSH